MGKSILVIATFLAPCFVSGAHAQVMQPAGLNSNILNSTVNIVTLDTSATALSAGASTSGTLSCSTYPGVSLYVIRNSVNTDLADFSIGAGSSWTASVNFTALLAQDLIFAKLTTSGIGCTNELPLAVSITYSPMAGLCDANPSACVTLSGSLTSTNGLPASNLTLTFRPSQMAFLGGVPPNSPAPSQGGCGNYPGTSVCISSNPSEYADLDFTYTGHPGTELVEIGAADGLGQFQVDFNNSWQFYTNGSYFDETTEHGDTSLVNVTNHHDGTGSSDAIAFRAIGDNYNSGNQGQGGLFIGKSDNAGTTNLIGVEGRYDSCGGEQVAIGVASTQTPCLATEIFASRFWGQPIDSDGIGGGSYKHWGAVFFGKLWLQDIQLQPEVVDTTSLFGDFGYTSGGAMIDVTCDSTQRGRMHYVNSAAGVADELEVCMKNIADTYAWEAVTVTP